MVSTDNDARHWPLGAAVQPLTFAACYVYSPSGLDAVSVRSRHLRASVKTTDARLLGRYAVRVRQHSSASTFAGFFRSGGLLVPVPGRRPAETGAISGPTLLARALFTEGLGAGVWSGLRRVRAVPKSATATPGARPTAHIHYESLTVDAGLGALSDCVLIDDIVSNGRTLWAAAARMQEAFPGCRIGAFALLRTIGFGFGVDRLLSPCIGEISWRGDVRRNP